MTSGKTVFSMVTFFESRCDLVLKMKIGHSEDFTKNYKDKRLIYVGLTWVLKCIPYLIIFICLHMSAIFEASLLEEYLMKTKKKEVAKKLKTRFCYAEMQIMATLLSPEEKTSIDKANSMG